jgi:hypothetical protein
MRDPALRSFLPEFVGTRRNLNDFWACIKDVSFRWAVNLAGAMATFLVDAWKARNLRESANIDRYNFAPSTPRHSRQAARPILHPRIRKIKKRASLTRAPAGFSTPAARLSVTPTGSAP